MIASAVASEGKTLTAANLALTLSESYRRNVLLIDADLRRPSLHTIFKVRGAPGLNEGLTAADEPKLPLHDVSPRLTILPAGMPNSDPMAGLTSRRMQSLIDEAREAFDWVIIDTPPVGLLTDANLLASMVDGAVLVIKAGSTPYDLVKRAVDTIGPSKLLGVVLNQAHGALGRYWYRLPPTTTTGVPRCRQKAAPDDARPDRAPVLRRHLRDGTHRLRGGGRRSMCAWVWTERI